jgi:hypothetical protein
MSASLPNPMVGPFYPAEDPDSIDFSSTFGLPHKKDPESITNLAEAQALMNDLWNLYVLAYALATDQIKFYLAMLRGGSYLYKYIVKRMDSIRYWNGYTDGMDDAAFIYKKWQAAGARVAALLKPNASLTRWLANNPNARYGPRAGEFMSSPGYVPPGTTRYVISRPLSATIEETAQGVAGNRLPGMKDILDEPPGGAQSNNYEHEIPPGMMKVTSGRPSEIGDGAVKATVGLANALNQIGNGSMVVIVSDEGWWYVAGFEDDERVARSILWRWGIRWGVK